MKQSQRGGYSGQSWKELERIINSGGQSRGQVFEDWLEIMLSAYLSATDNIGRNNRDIEKWDGQYEARYMAVVRRYPSNRPVGERPIDRFTAATAALSEEIERTQLDCLGEIFMCEITYGEHGQYFTPEPLCDMMTAIAVTSSIEPKDGSPPVIGDISGCGSGRMLISAHKIRPDGFFVGIDLDPRCAKMAALNLLLRGIRGDIYQGNSLSGDMQTVWKVRGPWITEHDAPKTPIEEPGKQLSLL